MFLGVPDDSQSKYKPNEDGKFNCLFLDQTINYDRQDSFNKIKVRN